MLMYCMMEVMTINKTVVMLSLLPSYVILLIIVYNFTDILQQNGGFEQVLFMIVTTTIYSYVASSIDKDTFRIKFSWFWTTLYVAGVAGLIICSGLNQNTVATWLSSLVSASFLIAGVSGSNG